MAIRKAQAVWNGTLKEGSGTFKGGSGALSGGYTFKTRFEDDQSQTNPEELIGAAHAACYAMFLSAQLTTANFPPESVTANAEVDFGRDDKGPVINGITLNVDAKVPGVSQEKFDELAQKSKEGCPISRALASVPITLNAKLTN
ncbi:MAG: OsmC family protein [Chloroflexi bacterium]|nr:OsmC family protein [Chloroflexota bacterium]MCC6892401.1 OsmC family protein [Anaerolineae bacterium]